MSKRGHVVVPPGVNHDHYGDLASVSVLPYDQLSNLNYSGFSAKYIENYLKKSTSGLYPSLAHCGIIHNIHSFPPTRVGGELCHTMINRGLSYIFTPLNRYYTPSWDDILFYLFKTLRLVAESSLVNDLIKIIFNMIVKLSNLSFALEEDNRHLLVQSFSRGPDLQLCRKNDLFLSKLYQDDLKLSKGWIDYKFIPLMASLWYYTRPLPSSTSLYGGSSNESNLALLFHLVKEKLYGYSGHGRIVYHLMRRLVYMTNSDPIKSIDSSERYTLKDYHISILITMFCTNMKFIITYTDGRTSTNSYCLGSYMPLHDPFALTLIINENLLDYEILVSNKDEFLLEINAFKDRFIHVWNEGKSISPFKLEVKCSDKKRQIYHLVLPEQFKDVILTE